MKIINFISIILLFLIIIYCGSNVNQKVDKALKEGKYTEAITLLNRVYKEDTTNYEYAEKIALAYIYRGENLFKRTGNVKSLRGNIKKAKEYLVKDPSDSIRKIYSRALFTLANAYINEKTQTDRELENNYHKAVVELKEALVNDTTNIQADSLLTKIKEDNFQRLIDKAKSLYNKGTRTGNIDLYFSAEYYLKNAAEFDPDNYDIRLLRSRINRKRLAILDYREGLSFAVMDYKHSRKHFAMHLAIKNYLNESISLNLNNFGLVSTKGDTFFVDERELKSRKFRKKVFVSFLKPHIHTNFLQKRKKKEGLGD